MTFFSILMDVIPCFSNNCGISLSRADSPNRSCAPILRIGTGYDSETTSETAEPNPPRILCSSHVTIAPVSLAAYSKISLSIGFIVKLSITLHDISSCLSFSAASNAIFTVIPVAAIVQSAPSLSVIPFPISNSCESE